MKICFATNNEHKLNEVRDAISSKIEIVSLHDIGCFDELPETSATLEGNSLQKANYVLQKYGVPCFADDTGLEVEGLNGEPGVYSARYAGPQRSSRDNIELLLKKLQGVPNRNAQFRTIISLVGLSESPVFFEGIVRGTIIEEARGTQGFGYDPIFVPTGFGLTFAEMDLSQKNTLSHRGLAVHKLAHYLLSTRSFSKV